MDDKVLEAIEARVNEVKGKRLFLGAMEAQALVDRKALLAEVKRLNIVLQDERKEHAKRCAHLRSTYIREAKRLEKQLSSVTAERDAAVEDLRKNRARKCDCCAYAGRSERWPCVDCQSSISNYGDGWKWHGAGQEQNDG